MSQADADDASKRWVKREPGAWGLALKKGLALGKGGAIDLSDTEMEDNEEDVSIIASHDDDLPSTQDRNEAFLNSPTPFSGAEKSSCSHDSTGLQPAWQAEADKIDPELLGSVDIACDKIQGILQSAVTLDSVLAVTKGPDPSHVVPANILALKETVDNERFPTRNSTVSRRWDKAVKSDLVLAKRYAQVPRNHSAQQAFKLEWTAGEYEVEMKTRTNSRTTLKNDVSKGEYLSFNCLVKAEGGGKLGYIAAKNYLFKARQLAAEGKTLRNRPLIVYNSWTQFCEILHCKNGFEDMISDSQVITTIAKQQGLKRPEHPELDHDGLKPLAIAGAPAKVLAKAKAKAKADQPGDEAGGNQGGGEPESNQGAKPKGKAKAKTKPGEGNPGGETPETKEGERVFRKMLKDAETLRDDLALALSQSSDLLGILHNNEEYDFASDKFLAPIRAARDKCENMKSLNAFWKHWLVKENWQKWVRKEFARETINYHLESEMPNWKAAIESVTHEMGTIRMMHLARTGKLDMKNMQR